MIEALSCFAASPDGSSTSSPASLQSACHHSSASSALMNSLPLVVFVGLPLCVLLSRTPRENAPDLWSFLGPPIQFLYCSDKGIIGFELWGSSGGQFNSLIGLSGDHWCLTSGTLQPANPIPSLNP